MGKLKLGIGFHTGTPCFCDGIGDFLADLDTDGHVITAKCNDGTASLVDFQNLVQKGATGVGVHRILRGHDVPPYGGDIYEAAKLYVDKVNEYWPPELDKELFYVECVNEVDKNESNWVGWFLCELSQQLMDAGYRFCGPGWSTGEPEPEHWSTEGMLAFLLMCSLNRDELAVGLHEYSLDANSLAASRPWMVGRVMWLNQVCIDHGFSLPDVIITEFGWTHNDVPAKSIGVNQIIEMVKWYILNAPNVLALHIWALDKSDHWPDIDDLVHPYMPLLLETIKVTDWPPRDIPLPPTQPDPPPFKVNLLLNPTFENGWCDHADYSSRIQVPNNWHIDVKGIGEFTSVINCKTGEPSIITGTREIVHKFAGIGPGGLPPSQWPDGENPLVDTGVWGLKRQGVNMIAEEDLHQTITNLVPFTSYTFTIKAKVHYQPDISSIGEPDDIEVLLTAGDSISYYVVEDLPDRSVEWSVLQVEGISDALGQLRVGVIFVTHFENSRDLFLDSGWLETIEVPVSEKAKKVVWIRAQEHSNEEATAIWHLALAEYGRTYTASHDDARDMVLAGNSSSYIVIWDAHLPSQQKVVDMCLSNNIKYEVRYLRDKPVTFPDNIGLGFLFKWRYVLTSAFNAPRSYGNGLHEGVDYDLIGGVLNNHESVLCTYNGVVVISGQGTSYGLRVSVRHNLNGNVFYTWYCHLDRIFVSVGDSVELGQPLGEIGITGVVTGEHVHFNLVIPGHGLHGYVIDDVVDPLPYLPNPSSLPLLSMPPVVVYDVLQYMRGDGRIYEVRHATGETETFQSQDGLNRSWKNVKNSQFEGFRYDDQYIWRDIDTSPGPAPDYAEHPGALRYYEQFESGMDAARWAMRFMAVGQTYTGPGHTVRFAYKWEPYPCEWSAANSGSATNVVTLIAHYDEYSWRDITVKDVILFQTNTGERMFFAAGFGLVAWSNSLGQESSICAIHQGRDDLEVERGCFNH